MGKNRTSLIMTALLFFYFFGAMGKNVFSRELVLISLLVWIPY